MGQICSDRAQVTEQVTEQVRSQGLERRGTGEWLQIDCLGYSTWSGTRER